MKNKHLVRFKDKPENLLQSECFKWSWNNLPETRGLICCNLNNSANAIEGNRNKSMGVIAGRSDMAFYWKGKAYMIEFKKPGQKQSAKQVKWEQTITSQGFDYYLIDSFEAFQELIRGIVGC